MKLINIVSIMIILVERFTKVKKVKKDYSWREFIVDLAMKV